MMTGEWILGVADEWAAVIFRLNDDLDFASFSNRRV